MKTFINSIHFHDFACLVTNFDEFTCFLRHSALPFPRHLPPKVTLVRGRRRDALHAASFLTFINVFDEKLLSTRAYSEKALSNKCLSLICLLPHPSRPGLERNLAVRNLDNYNNSLSRHRPRECKYRICLTRSFLDSSRVAGSSRNLLGVRVPRLSRGLFGAFTLLAWMR